MYLKDAPRLQRDGETTRIIIPVYSFKDADELNRFIESASSIWTDKNDGAKVTLKIEKASERRSLNANAYYWQLLNKVSLEIGMPAVELHNRTLAGVGIPWDMDGERTYMIHSDDDWWMSLTEFHFAPTDMTEEDEDGTVKRLYYLLKPSHLMDRREMTVLINSIVEDAKALGIETLTPDELSRMLAAWGGKENGI